jgi:hypothetical protein
LGSSGPSGPSSSLKLSKKRNDHKKHTALKPKDYLNPFLSLEQNSF